jgi:hypothetical protein
MEEFGHSDHRGHCGEAVEEFQQDSQEGFIPFELSALHPVHPVILSKKFPPRPHLCTPAQPREAGRPDVFICGQKSFLAVFALEIP